MIRARFENLEQVFPDCPQTLIIPLHRLFERVKKTQLKSGGGFDTAFPELKGKAVIAEIPSIIWPTDTEEVRGMLSALLSFGIRDALAENIGAVELAGELGFIVHGGMFLNVTNAEAFEQFIGAGCEDITLSFELPFSQLAGLENEKAGLVTYGYLPLMKFRNCPAQGKKGCAGCAGKSFLTDRKGERFAIICRERRYSELLNCVPLYVGDRHIPQTGFETLYFTVETQGECRRIYELYRNKKTPDFRRTAGLYFRDVL